jgi:hypothetical protein
VRFSSSSEYPLKQIPAPEKKNADVFKYVDKRASLAGRAVRIAVDGQTGPEYWIGICEPDEWGLRASRVHVTWMFLNDLGEWCRYGCVSTKDMTVHIDTIELLNRGDLQEQEENILRVGGGEPFTCEDVANFRCLVPESDAAAYRSTKRVFKRLATCKP